MQNRNVQAVGDRERCAGFNPQVAREQRTTQLLATSPLTAGPRMNGWAIAWGIDPQMTQMRRRPIKGRPRVGDEGFEFRSGCISQVV
jgi:hypothetical protein